MLLPKFDFKTIAFVSLLGSSLILFVLSIALPTDSLSRSVIAIIALIADILAFSVRFYSYLIIPMVRMSKRTIILNQDEPYAFSVSNNAIIVRGQNTVYSSVFLRIPWYMSSTEMSDEEKINFSSNFGKIISLRKKPFMVSTQLQMVNKDIFLNKIRDKLNEAEDKYRTMSSEKNAGAEAMEKEKVVKGELTMWHNLYDNILKTQSNALVSYVMTTEIGGTEEEATNLALQSAEEVSAGISSLLGIPVAIATGDEIRSFIEPEYMIPYSTISEQLKEKAVETGA
jgi:hypothetical protein